MNPVNAKNAKISKGVAKKAIAKTPVEVAAEAKLAVEDLASTGPLGSAFHAQVVSESDGGQSGGGMGSTALILGGIALAGGVAVAAAGGGKDTNDVPIPTPTPPQPLPSYSVAAPASVDEGKTVTFTITDANKVSGQKVTWSINPERAGDIEGPTSGEVTIDQYGKATVEIAIKADKATEVDVEKLILTVGSQNTSVTINDTSKTPPPAPQTFTLTSSVDQTGVLKGDLGTTSTAGDDTFNAFATATVLQAWDTIDGGAGTDVLNIYTDGSNNDTQSGTIKGIETVNINNSKSVTVFASSGIDASKFADATLINQIGKFASVTKLAGETTAKFTNVDMSAAGAAVTAATSATSAAIQLDAVKPDLVNVDSITLPTLITGVPAGKAMSYFGVDAGSSTRHFASTGTNIIQGVALNTVNIGGTVVGLPASAATNSIAAEGSAVVAIGVGVTTTELKLNASVATGFGVVGFNGTGADRAALLTSIDASGSTASVGFDSGNLGNQISESGLKSFKSGSGDDIVAVTVVTAKDDPATPQKNEQRDGLIDLGAGRDLANLTVAGNGVALVNLGAGNDFAVIQYGAGAIVSNFNTATTTISAGDGNDVIDLRGKASELFSKQTTGQVTTAASGLTIDGGAGQDTLTINVGDKAVTTELASFITTNVSNVETLLLAGDTTVDASKLSEFSTLIFPNKSTVTNAVGTQSIVAAAGADLTVTAKDFVLDADTVTDGNQPTLAGSVNIVAAPNSSGNALLINAKDVTLTGSVSLLNNENQTGNATTVATSAIYLTGNLDPASGAFGYIENLTVALQGGRGAGANAADEAVAKFELAPFSETGEILAGTKTVKFTGAGDVTFDANLVVDGTLTSIDLSGMTEFLDLTATGVSASYSNLSKSALTLNAAVAETVKLGGAQDTITVGSTVAKMDVIQGFKAVKSTLESTATKTVADTSRSDDLAVAGVNTSTTPFMVLATSYATLDLGLAAAATFNDGTSNQKAYENVVFTVGNDTYVYVDKAVLGTADADDTLVKLEGVTDAALIASLLNNTSYGIA